MPNICLGRLTRSSYSRTAEKYPDYSRFVVEDYGDAGPTGASSPSCYAFGLALLYALGN